MSCHITANAETLKSALLAARSRWTNCTVQYTPFPTAEPARKVYTIRSISRANWSRYQLPPSTSGVYRTADPKAAVALMSMGHMLHQEGDQ